MPRVSLTNAFLQSVACPGGRAQEDFRDAHRDGPGLSLRVGAGGSKVWAFLYRLHGRERRYRIGSFPAIGLADARQAARRLRAMVDNGLDPQVEKATSQAAARSAHATTVKAVFASYLETLRRRERRQRTLDDLAGLFERHVKPVIGERSLPELTHADVGDVLDRLERRGAAVTRNRTLTLVRALARFSEVSPDPTVGFERLPERAKDFAFSVEQLARIWRALDEPDAAVSPITANAIRLMMVTLKRGAEVAGAQISEIDRDNALWTIPRDRTKGGRPDAVPLAPAALDIVKSTLASPFRPSREKEPAVLFPSPRDPTQSIARNAMSRAMARTLRTAGIDHPQASLHSIRDSGATWASVQGYAPHIVSGLLGHSPRSAAASPITAKYQHYDFITERRETLRVWGDVLMEAVGGNTLQPQQWMTDARASEDLPQ